MGSDGENESKSKSLRGRCGGGAKKEDVREDEEHSLCLALRTRRKFMGQV